LNLEYKQSSNDEESSEESRDGTIKFSKFSNKIKMERQKSGEMENIIKPIVYNIINCAFEQIDKNQKESSEEEDEYIRQIEQRRMKNDDTQNKISSIVNNTISNSRLANKFIETYKLRIYLLNSQSYIDIAVAINETIRDIKGKILAHMIKSGKYKIKYECIEAYELRLVDDEDDDILPNMEYPALDDKLNILKSRADILAFVEKINFNPDTDMSAITTNILGSSVRNFETV
jgi:phosphoribosylformylglycinamidine (FGAM) synthase PurS component